MYGQILTARAVIIESSDGLGRQPLLTAAQAARAANVSVTSDTPITLSTSRAGTETSTMRVLAVNSGHPGVVVAVAGSRDVIDETLQSTRAQLLVLGIAALVLSSAGAWFLAGGALRPMERMRRQAAELQGHDFAGGVAVPTTKDEVARLAVTLNELLARQHVALQREQAFVADAGHELRTPLTVLKGELELASRPGRSRAELTQSIATVSQETDRLVRLAEDLLDLSGRHRAARPMSQFNLSDLIRAAVDRANSWATAAQVTLAADLPSRFIAYGNPMRLRQAVDNLLNNAIKMSPPAGAVSITAYTRDLDLCIEVRDQGPGFPQMFLPIAFDRFTRSDQSRTRGTVPGQMGGSGLGLAIVKAIMDEHHGLATAQNNPEPPGARLRLSWPGTRPLNAGER